MSDKLRNSPDISPKSSSAKNAFLRGLGIATVFSANVVGATPIEYGSHNTDQSTKSISKKGDFVKQNHLFSGMPNSDATTLGGDSDSPEAVKARLAERTGWTPNENVEPFYEASDPSKDSSFVKRLTESFWQKLGYDTQPVPQNDCVTDNSCLTSEQQDLMKHSEASETQNETDVSQLALEKRIETTNSTLLNDETVKQCCKIIQSNEKFQECIATIAKTEDPNSLVNDANFQQCLDDLKSDLANNQDYMRSCGSLSPEAQRNMESLLRDVQSLNKRVIDNNGIQQESAKLIKRDANSTSPASNSDSEAAKSIANSVYYMMIFVGGMFAITALSTTVAWGSAAYTYCRLYCC